MTDPYQKCPCGCGRNLKHCASKSVLAGLETIEQSIEGDQRIAAINEIDRLLQSEPDSTVLLAMKTRLCFELGQRDEAVKTLEKFESLAADSPTVHALNALATAQTGDPACLDHLLKAWEKSEDADQMSIMLSIVTVSQTLMRIGQAHTALAILSHIQGREGDMIQRLQYEALKAINEEHPLLQYAGSIDPPPEDHPLREQLAAVDENMQDLMWLKADEMLRELGRQHPDDAQVMRRIGRSMLLRRQDNVHEAWKRLANLESAEEGERLFAEAVAAMLSPLDDEWITAVVEVTYPVEDLDPVMEKMLSHPQLVSQQVPAPRGDEPPPRAVFMLLDREPPEGDGADIKLEDWPESLTPVFVYGKQTDAPARLKVITSEELLSKCHSVLESIVGSLKESGRETLDRTNKSSLQTQKRLYVWEQVSPATLERVKNESQRHELLTAWPRTPSPALGGLTPAVAARDKSRRQTVNALVVVRELDGSPHSCEAYRELRKSLGLPHELLAPGDIQLDKELPLDALTRIPVADLSDEQLSHVLLNAAGCSSLEMDALEVAVTRPSLKADPRLELHRVCANVARGVENPLEALHWTKLAVECAEVAKHSPAEYLLAMLMPAVMIGDGETANQALQRLSSQHINEPGIREAIMQFMQMVGIDPQTGAPMGGAPAAAPAAAAPKDGGLWTPDGGGGGGGGGAAGGEEGGSGLWLPD